jgi:hypothetical protein
LKYAGYNGSGWTVETVDEAPFDSVGVYASLALDSQDRPHIAYGVSTSTPRVGLDLKYAVKDNTWTWNLLSIGDHLAVDFLQP